MATIVLVGGSFLAAACWDLVVEELRVIGHDATAVELTGLGARRAAGSPKTVLDDHAEDILEVLRAAPGPLILVAHSYGAAPACVAAARYLSGENGTTLRSAVVLGGVLPTAGKSLFQTMPAANASFMRTLVRNNDGWRIPVLTDEQLGFWGDHRMTDSDRVEFRRHAFGHPVGTYEQAVSDDLVILDGLPKTYVVLEGDSGEPPIKVGSPGWSLATFDSGHWPMITRPVELARFLADHVDEIDDRAPARIDASEV